MTENTGGIPPDTKGEGFKEELAREIARYRSPRRLIGEMMHGDSDYVGPNNSVYGEIVPRGDGQPPDIFGIHFVPKIGLILPFNGRWFPVPRILRERALREGAEDLLDFLNALQTREDLKSIKTIQALTNYRMAKFAVKELGFHFVADPGKTEAEIKADAEKKGFHIDIQISKEDLLAQADKVRQLVQPRK